MIWEERTIGIALNYLIYYVFFMGLMARMGGGRTLAREAHTKKRALL